MLSSRSTGVLVLLAGLALAPSAPAQQAPAATAGRRHSSREPRAGARVVLPMKGSYVQHPDAFAQLGGFLAAAA